MSKQYQVIIGGAGIGGVAMAILLERANITDYLIVERFTAQRPMGSALVLSAQVLRLFEQLGLYDELVDISMTFAGGAYFTQGELKKIGEVKAMNFEERYGYYSRLFSRADLYSFLLSKVPAQKIQWNKRILSTMQNKEGVMVRCSDGSTYDAKILVGADGAYSAVRQSLHQNMILKKLNVPSEDLKPMRFDHFCVVGVTNTLDGEDIPELKAKFSRMEMIISDKEDYNLYVMPLKGLRLGWTFGGNILAKYRDTKDPSFRLSDWSSQSVDDIKQNLKDIPSPLGGTLGFLMDNTENISTVVLEDKCFSVWTEGRTVLIGDAAHKLVPAGGQGANLAILDALCLVNLLLEMPSWTFDNITTALETYVKIRQPHAKQAVTTSGDMSWIMCWKGFIGNMLRGLVLNAPEWIVQMPLDRAFSGRPQLSCLPEVPLKGSLPNTAKEMTLGLKKKEQQNEDSSFEPIDL